jgi:chaperonin cofactor prefoldin
MSVGLLGGKGKRPEQPPPVDRVKSMMQTGLSEREIIRQLKAEGYGFGDIEKAMLTALREGVTAAPVPAAAPPVYAQAPQQPVPPGPAQYPAPEWPQPAYAPQPPPMYDEEREAIPLELPPLEAPSAAETPEDIMEDILEGLTEEKFEKFTGEIKKVREEFERMRAELRAAMQKPVVAEAAVPKEVTDKLDDLEARVGGLEKAFRQFLPQLTQNIDELAKIIREMKKQSSV